MEQVLTRIDIRLEEMSRKLECLEGVSRKLERLEVQNEILRKELHGIRSSSNQEAPFALMEAKTLREVVEEVQFDVKTINAKLTDLERQQKEKEESADDEFQVVEIRSKTLEEEQNWLKGKFTDMRTKTDVQDGAYSNQEIDIETISNYIPLPSNSRTSCVLKLTSHLNHALKDPKFHFWRETNMIGPSVVGGHLSDVFLGSGNYCSFFCSFPITSSLRLAIFCQNQITGKIWFYIGFIPENVPTDQALQYKLYDMKPTSDICHNCGISFSNQKLLFSSESLYKSKYGSTDPAELFVTSGQFLVRGHMVANGRRAVVQVEILKTAPQPTNRSLNAKAKNMSSYLERPMEDLSRSFRRTHNLHREDVKISCSIESFNLLNVALQIRKIVYCDSHNNFKGTEVLPFQGVTFFASHGWILEGMLSFEIESTDLCLVVYFKAEKNKNSFAGAFLPLFEKGEWHDVWRFMRENQWKFHDWIKTVEAKEGEQVLEIRNIRALISMTEAEKSRLKIQVFAF